MSLTALPVTTSDLTTLQLGVQFFSNSTQAASEVTSINTPGSGASVFTYAASLITSNISLSQVAMAVGAIAESGTLAVGAAGTANTLTHFTMDFLPAQIAFAASQGLNQTVYAAEALGEALSTSASSSAAFAADWGSLSPTAFVTAVAGATGIHASAITTWLTNWTSILGNATEAYGATLGDAIGTALLNPTSANLQTVFSTPSSNGFSPNTGSGLVQNALIDVATGQYVTGVALGALPTHTPLQGQAAAPPTIITLTTGVDIVTLNQSNSTVNGTLGGSGAGSTWTAGDTITAAAGTTGQVFNIDGIGTAFVINPTTLTGNTVSGVQTVNIISNVNGNGFSDQAVQGNFTATGSQGDWVGLTTLNITSGGNAVGADNITADSTTAVNILDSLFQSTTAGNPLTVNGGSVDTIIENNTSHFNDGGIDVNGVTGTTSVSITQTENSDGHDGIVAITDAAGTSSTLGTITSIVLNGITGGLGSVHNTIVDNALGNLSVWNSDSDGAILDVTNTLTPTLNLNLSADGINPDGSGHNWLVINDLSNEYSTVNLTLGNSNSYLLFTDNSLTTLTTAAGNGALVGGNQGPTEFIDHAAAAVNLDFSGLNGANDIHVDRGSGVNNDVFSLGNFGSNNLVAGDFQELIITNGNANNTDTINFGSGAYQIFDAPHAGTINPHTYVNTAPNGAGLASGLPGAEQWADIHNAASGDFLTFKGDTVQNTFNFGGVGSIAAGIADGLSEAPHSASTFHFAGATFVFDHVGSSTVNIAPSDAMVELVGVSLTGSTMPGGIIHLT
jgi:hypothetical protein